MFNQDLIESNSVSFESLYKLPKTTSISRARAKIQNEFRLFQASESVRDKRKELDSEQREFQVENKPADSKISIFCDESGKNERFNIVGSLWINDGYRFFKLFNELSKWKESKEIQRELHFNNLKKTDLVIVREFFEIVLGQSDVLSFKAVVLDSANIRQMSSEDRNFRLHYQLVAKGVEHEVSTGRIKLPRNISLTKDKDDGADKLRLVELEQRLKTECPAYFKQAIEVDEVKSEESHSSFFIQIADLFAASINRKLNTQGENYKDDMANMILGMLGINVLNREQNTAQDFVKVLWI